MKFFETIQMHALTLGVSSSNHSSQKYPFNRRVLVGFLIFGCSILSHLSYIFLVANGFMDYMVCICSTWASILMFAGFAIIVFKSASVFDSIDNFETFVDTSKLVSSSISSLTSYLQSSCKICFFFFVSLIKSIDKTETV